MKNLKVLLTFVLLLTLLSACSGSRTTMTDSPAVRVNITNKAQNELRQTVASSLHQADIRILKSALTQSSTLMIQREILLGMDFSKPFIFNLVKKNKQCFLINAQTKKRYLLAETQCIAQINKP